MNLDWLLRVWGNELFILAVLSLAFVAWRFVSQFQGFSFLALASACCAVFNPYVAHKILWLLGIKTFWMFYFPSMYVVPLAAVILGHIALRGIKRAETPLRGKTFAWVGCCLGYLLIISNVGFFLLLCWGVSGVVG